MSLTCCVCVCVACTDPALPAIAFPLQGQKAGDHNRNRKDEKEIHI